MLALAGCATASAVDTRDRGADARRMPANASPPRCGPTPLPAVPLCDLDDKRAAPRRGRGRQGRAGELLGDVVRRVRWRRSTRSTGSTTRVQGSGGVVIGVAVGEPREKAAAFAREHSLRYAQLVDEDLELADALGQKRLPATLVLDRAGRVVLSGGALDERALSAFRAALRHQAGTARVVLAPPSRGDPGQL